MNNNQMLVQQESNPIMIIHGLNLDRVTKSMEMINQFQQVVQGALTPGIDYGSTFSGSKPSLLKPGAEKILMLLGLSSEYEIIEKIQDYESGFFAYTVRCVLKKNGIIVTEGLGHCNSKERKYDKEKADIYMLGNTCLKMAKKRAQVDAALTVGSLSNIFTQDLEDMAEFEQSERMETMTIEDAKAIKIRFGKYGANGGKTLGEIYSIDEKYIRWLADKANDEVVRKAAKIILDSANQTKVDNSNKTTIEGVSDESFFEGTPFEE